MSDILDKTTQALGTSLNMRMLRNNVVSSNIANAETPGYKAKKVDFEDQLARALQLESLGKVDARHPRHFGEYKGQLGRVRPDVYDNPDINLTNDKNTVDLEKEMSKLAENTILYRSTIELMKKKLGAMKYAITEGGR